MVAVENEFMGVTSPFSCPSTAGDKYVRGFLDSNQSFRQMFPYCKPIVVITEKTNSDSGKVAHEVYLKMRDGHWTMYSENDNMPQKGIKDEDVMKIETDHFFYHNGNYESYTGGFEASCPAF